MDGLRLGSGTTGGDPSVGSLHREPPSPDAVKSLDQRERGGQADRDAVLRLAALLALTLAAVTTAAQAQSQPYESRIRPLPDPVLASLRNTDSWKPGCPVHHSDLRLLEVTAWGWDERPYTGQLVVRLPRLAVEVHPPPYLVCRSAEMLKSPGRMGMD